MSDRPESGTGDGVKAVYTGDQPNPILNFIRQPRITLLILAGWSLLGVVTQAITANSIFLDNDNREMDGAIGGFAFGWEGIPLAVLYVYCFRSPDKHHNIFWLALIHMASISASQVYHLGNGDFSFESIAVPLFGSAGIGALAFLNAFMSDDEPETKV